MTGAGPWAIFIAGFLSLSGIAPLVSASVPMALSPIATGLSSPVALAAPADGSGRLFIAEQAGVIRILKNGDVLPTPFLDISPLVSSGGERGLLGLAFHPAYAMNGRFFVFYTDHAGNLVIAGHAVTADPDIAWADGSILLTIPHPTFSNHNGGQLAFGPDGFLYAATGDGGGGGDPAGNGQSLAVLLGKILRLDVNGASLIPADNPFVDGDPSTRDEIWAYGLRNPWRFSFDRRTGDVFIGDVGQGCWEEVDFAPADTSAGRNYGWSAMEGSKCYAPPSCSPPPFCVDSSFTMPILSVSHDDGSECAIVGGFRYRGSQIPALAGSYLFADYCSGRIRIAGVSGGVWTVADPPLETRLNITTFGEDESGELWVADAAGGVGRIVSGLSWSDDFEDADASDWMVRSGSWTVAGGRLSGSGVGRAEIVSPAPPCSECTVEASVRLEASGAEASLIGWRRSGEEFVELRLLEARDRLVLRQVSRGRSRTKHLDRLLDPGTEIHLRIAWNGQEFQVFLDDAGPVLRMKDIARPRGGVGFRVRGGGTAVSASFDDVAVH